MIYTMRTFQVAREHYQEFVRLSEEEMWPAFEEMGGRALGLWIVTMGGRERIVLMARYESLAHWQETRSMGPPGGILRKAVAERAKLIDDTDLIALTPLTRRRPESDAPEKEPGIYTLRTFKVDRQDIDRFVTLSEDGWWPWVEKGQGLRPLALWMPTVAPEMQIYLMARYDDLAHWEATRGPGPEPEDPALREIWADGRDAIRERSSLVLDTGVRFLRPISRRRP